jgi:hypothetical protein
VTNEVIVCVDEWLALVVYDRADDSETTVDGLLDKLGVCEPLDDTDGEADIVSAFDIVVVVDTDLVILDVNDCVVD